MPDLDAPGELPVEAEAQQQFLLCLAGGRPCAFVLESVREILPAPGITRLPGAPAWILGLVNRRGTLITTVDLGMRMREIGTGDVRSVIVVEGAGKVFGIAVDEVRGVRTIADHLWEPADTGPGADGTVTHVARVPDLDMDMGADPIARCDAAAVARQALVT